MAEQPDDWSFNQPVLLNKTRRNSSTLVWTLVGSTVFATGWAFLAPLPETVAVQGKLQPSTPAQTVVAAVPGVVSDVLVGEGDRVGQGDVLLRFDPREAEARLEAATLQRDGLHDLISVERAVLGELPVNELTASQRQLYNQQLAEQDGQADAERAALERSDVRLAGLERSLAASTTIAEHTSNCSKRAPPVNCRRWLPRRKSTACAAIVTPNARKTNGSRRCRRADAPAVRCGCARRSRAKHSGSPR